MWWTLLDASLGLVLGFVFAWAYFLREEHRELKKLDQDAEIPINLIIKRTLSIVLVVIVVLSTNVIVGAYQPSALNTMVYVIFTILSAIGIWKVFFKPKK